MPTKSNVTRRAPPSDKRIIPASSLVQPQNWDAQKVQVLRIPASSSSHVMIHLNTIKIEESQPLDGDTAAETRESEGWVKHVPNIQGYKDAVFEWDFRTLVAANFDDGVPEECRGWWLMYMCTKPVWGLPSTITPYFEQDTGVRAHGDVFVFKLDGESDHLGPVKYAEKWSMPKDEKDERNILVSLALASLGEGRRTVRHAETSVARRGDRQ